MDDVSKCQWRSHQSLWYEGGSGGVPFLEAGPLKPVRPRVRGKGEEYILAEEADEYEEEFEIDGDMEGEVGERIALPKEDEYVRKLQDPVMPSKEVVDIHYIKGHIPFRSWCHVCVEAMGKDMDHPKDEGNPRKLPE